MSTPPRITFVTPSFAGDYERFAFQRESMERCGIDIPHIVLVDDEDVALFRGTPHQHALTVVSSKEALPPSVERVRRRGRLPGWSLQQVLKLAAAPFVDTEAYVCLDSDNFWVRPVSDDVFFAPDGRLYLFEYDYLTVEILQWVVDSLRFLGLSDRTLVVGKTHVHEIIPMLTAAVVDLHRFIEDRHGRHWAQAMVDHHVIEYTTYGGFVRYVEGLRRVVPAAVGLCMGYWTDEAYASFATDFPEAVELGGARAGMVHSRLGIPPSAYRPVVARLWRTAVAG